MESVPPALDFLHLGPSVLLKSFMRFELAVSVPGTSRAEASLLAADSACLDSTLLARSTTKLGSSLFAVRAGMPGSLLLLRSWACADLAVPVSAFGHLGSTLPIRTLVRLDLSLLTFGEGCFDFTSSAGNALTVSSLSATGATSFGHTPPLVGLAACGSAIFFRSFA